MAKDFIPIKQEEFHLWQLNFVKELSPNLATWSIPAAAFEALLQQQTVYEKAYSVAGAGHATTRTQQQVMAKYQATKQYKTVLRLFIKNYLAFNVLIEDSSRLALRITVRDKVPTSSKAPAGVPDLFCIPRTGNRIEISLRQLPRQTGSRSGKPDDAGSFEIAYLAGQNITMANNLVLNNERGTRSPHTITFKPADAGKIITFFARWIGKNGQLGQWSQGIEEVVPK